eukprot:gene24306-9910_t
MDPPPHIAAGIWRAMKYTLDLAAHVDARRGGNPNLQSLGFEDRPGAKPPGDDSTTDGRETVGSATTGALVSLDHCHGAKAPADAPPLGAKPPVDAALLDAAGQVIPAEPHACMSELERKLAGVVVALRGGGSSALVHTNVTAHKLEGGGAYAPMHGTLMHHALAACVRELKDLGLVGSAQGTEESQQATVTSSGSSGGLVGTAWPLVGVARPLLVTVHALLALHQPTPPPLVLTTAVAAACAVTESVEALHTMVVPMLAGQLSAGGSILLESAAHAAAACSDQSPVGLMSAGGLDDASGSLQKGASGSPDPDEPSGSFQKGASGSPGPDEPSGSFQKGASGSPGPDDASGSFQKGASGSPAPAAQFDELNAALDTCLGQFFTLMLGCPAKARAVLHSTWNPTDQALAGANTQIHADDTQDTLDSVVPPPTSGKTLFQMAGSDAAVDPSQQAPVAWGNIAIHHILADACLALTQLHDAQAAVRQVTPSTADLTGGGSDSSSKIPSTSVQDLKPSPKPGDGLARGGEDCSEEGSLSIRVGWVPLAPPLMQWQSKIDTLLALQGLFSACSLEQDRVGAMQGQSGTMQGQSGTMQGQAGTMQGRSGTMQGQAGTMLGQAGMMQGRAGTKDGQAGLAVAETQDAEVGLAEAPAEDAQVALSVEGEQVDSQGNIPSQLSVSLQRRADAVARVLAKHVASVASSMVLGLAAQLQPYMPAWQSSPSAEMLHALALASEIGAARTESAIAVIRLRIDELACRNRAELLRHLAAYEWLQVHRIEEALQPHEPPPGAAISDFLRTLEAPHEPAPPSSSSFISRANIMSAMQVWPKPPFISRAQIMAAMQAACNDLPHCSDVLNILEKACVQAVGKAQGTLLKSMAVKRSAAVPLDLTASARELNGLMSRTMLLKSVAVKKSAAVPLDLTTSARELNGLMSK